MGICIGLLSPACRLFCYFRTCMRVHRCRVHLYGEFLHGRGDHVHQQCGGAWRLEIQLRGDFGCRGHGMLTPGEGKPHPILLYLARCDLPPSDVPSFGEKIDGALASGENHTSYRGFCKELTPEGTRVFFLHPGVRLCIVIRLV